jgi:hypothetical protein
MEMCNSWLNLPIAVADLEEGWVIFATNVQSNVSKTPDLGPQMAEKVC